MPIRTTPGLRGGLSRESEQLFATSNAPDNVREERERLEQRDPRIVITMVHGTWARRAKWVEPDSRFGEWLRRELAPALVVPLRWSGRNSIKARSEAVHKLRAHIIKVRVDYPNARHAFIAHSHGGNVVLCALADQSLAEKTLGVATLGTPFLSAQLRDTASLFGPMDGFVAAMFAGISVFSVGATLGYGRRWWLPALLTCAAVAVVLLAASYAASLMQAHAGRVRDRMPPTKLKATQVAIVRTSADEAAAALSGARVAGGFASIFWAIVTGPLVSMLRGLLKTVDYFGVRAIQESLRKHAFEKHFGVTESPTDSRDSGLLMKSVLESVVPYFPLIVFTLLDDSHAVARSAGAVFAIGYGLPALGALLIGMAPVPFGVIFALGLLPCGWTLPFAGPYLNLTAEPAPPGTWSVTQLDGDAQGALSHGRSHDDDEAIGFVADWLKERLAAARAGETSAV